MLKPLPKPLSSFIHSILRHSNLARHSSFVLRISCLLALAARPAAALTPDQVAVIYNTKSAESQRLAKFYMKARAIPEGNLMPLICGVSEHTTEEVYRRRIVPQVQGWLKDKPGIKCLVTTYDIPLRIDSWLPTLPERQEITGFQARQDAILGELDDALADYEKIAGGTPSTQPAPQPSTAPRLKRKWQDQVPKLNAAANAAVTRMEKLTGAERAKALQDFAKVQDRVAGLNGLVAGFHVKEGTPESDPGRAQIERLQVQLRDTEQKIADLMKDKHNPASRRQIMALRRVTHGLIGEARQIDDVLVFLQPPETESCFDNELALVLGDQDYPRARWMPNPHNVDAQATLKNLPWVPKSILVTRLDGPSVDMVEKMIQTGLKTEKDGLKGKMYLDARGITTGPYSVFDIYLRELNRWMKDHSQMQVVFDDKSDMLQAKDCPDAALYCGWYSLHLYQDVCQWVPGGVGYHVASGEMLTLHDPNDTGWVKALLVRGYCGTLGPTAEPYLSSFSNPAHFFPLLLSGEFTQGEVWELTAPMLSWRTGFVGDPLYNPFRANPQVKVESLREHPILRNAFTILRNEKPAP